VHLKGEGREVWLDESEVFLIPRAKVADVSTDCNKLGEYAFSGNLVKQLFGKLPD
jgi:hypothetical protein